MNLNVLILAASLPLMLAAELAVEVKSMDGVSVPPGAVKLMATREIAANGMETVRCRLVALRDGEQRLRLVATLPLKGDEDRIFDGFQEQPLAGMVTRELLLNDVFPMGAAWSGRAAVGRALALGVESGDSYADFTGTASNLVISVHAALLKSGAVYETVFHAFTFAPKYGVMDAFARYYPLYPASFKPNPEVDPDLYGIAAQYGSWRMANPERCRMMNATWDWCIGAGRTWGDPLDLEQPVGPRNGDYSWDEEITYLDRAGKVHRYLNGEIDQAKFNAVRDERLGFGYYCGVHNSFYMMALANISPKIAARHPDSVITPNSFDDHGYPYSTPVFTFPECSWGKELRRQLKVLSETMEAGSPAFDVSKPRAVYRGARLWEMKNVSWDKFGPGIVRGIASAKLFDYIHTLPVKGSRYKMGVAVNSGGFHVTDKFRADITMTERTPWDLEKPYPLCRRLIAGEKGLTMWEGYSQNEIAPDFRVWPQVAKDRLINELAHAAVHVSFRTGASLPAGFLSEYAALMSHAFIRFNRAGWKPVPGAVAKVGGVELARYGLGEESWIAVNNLSNVVRQVELELFPSELAAGRALPVADPTEGCVVYAPFFGGKAQTALGSEGAKLSCEVGPMLAVALEAMGVANGKGAFSVEEGGDFGSWRVTVNSEDFAGEIAFKERLDATYRLVGDKRRTLVPGGRLVVEYCNSALKGALAKIRAAADFQEVRHGPDADSRDQAERVAFFVLKATGTRAKMVADASLGARTVAVAGVTVAATDRQDFSHLVKRLIDVIHRERFPAYRPIYPMSETDRGRYPQLRL